MITCSHVHAKGFRGHIHELYLLKGAIYNVFDTILPSIFYQYSLFIQEIVMY